MFTGANQQDSNLESHFRPLQDRRFAPFSRRSRCMARINSPPFLGLLDYLDVCRQMSHHLAPSSEEQWPLGIPIQTINPRGNAPRRASVENTVLSKEATLRLIWRGW